MEPNDSHMVATAAAPGLAEWLARHKMLPGEFAARIGTTREAVRKYCLPFSDAGRQVPGLKIMERIVAASGGELSPADFYPAHLSAGSGDAGDEGVR